MQKLFVTMFLVLFSFAGLPAIGKEIKKPVKQTVSTVKSDKALMAKRHKKASSKLTPKAQKGLKILTAQNLSARNDLRKKGLSSINKGVKSPVDAVPADFALRTILVEHTAKATPKQVNHLLEKVADKPKVLSGIKSPKKATGAVQLMPKTYATMVSRYPKANLEKDFAKGASDNRNAMKALHLLADDDRKCTRSKNVKVLAAAYNGGCYVGKKLAKGKGAKMPAETRGYVTKHKQLDKLFGVS